LIHFLKRQLKMRFDEEHPWDAYRWFVDLSVQKMTEEFPDTDKEILLHGCNDECRRRWPTLTDEQKQKFEQLAQLDARDEKRRKKLKKRKMKEANESEMTNSSDLDQSWTVNGKSIEIDSEATALDTSLHNGSPNLKKVQQNGVHTMSPREIKAEKNKSFTESPNSKKAEQSVGQIDEGKASNKDENADSTKKKKRRRDPNLPKQGLSAFFIFMSDNREKLKAANPDFGNPEIAKELSRRWKDLTEEEKEPYLTRQEEDKNRYNQEMAEYRSSQKATDE